MKLIALASAAAALVATVAAERDCLYNCNSTCVESEPKVRVFNRCPYKVYLWSIFKGEGCPSDQAAQIEQGGFYQENYASPQGGVGVSLKISKTNKCKPDDTVQLEYYLEESNPSYTSNYLDVSYVDCQGGDCPTRQEGYYLKSGNENGQFMANALNEICPILSCSNSDECDKCSYINPDDRQTKSCPLKANLDFYMCGGEAPGEEPSNSAPASSAAAAPSSTQAYEAPASSSAAKETPAYSSEEAYAPTSAAEVAAAEVTPAPQQPNIKTEVVYVTQFEYVNAKRHAHGHRHQHFRA